MAGFLGGSAFALVQSIASGSFLVTDRSLKRLDAGELRELVFELDRQLRTKRGEQPAIEDLTAVQQRHRQIQRLTGVIALVRAHQQKRAKGKA
jgi:hypothetical protein